jgi:L-lactate dehydrogenase
LDTARFRTLLALQLGVDPHHVHAYVIGEHGDSEVLAWSLVSIGGIPLDEFCELRGLEVCSEDKDEIDVQVRKAAYEIIEGKGATYYGIGGAIARITQVILGNQRSILTVCTPVDEITGVENVTLALPNLVGGEGIITTLAPPLNDPESQGLRKSAQLIREAIISLE